ncbi:hypothetical protein MRB53_017519 [Persea americana]|uniref:Uncharacterized protein n=1 Tax=Persea americana TaxID=3435 RepID=A0ACC2M5A1_PERAE|nr:hypothetical protein MRB53_017519 [Persea americana]
MKIKDCYFPLFISLSVIQREKDHNESFAPEGKKKKQLWLLLSLVFSFSHSPHSSPHFSLFLKENKIESGGLKLKSSATSTSSTFDPTRVTQLSWHPRTFLYTGFLSNAECDLAKNKLEKSMVADNDSGKSIMSKVRTSSGMFLKRDQVGNSMEKPIPFLDQIKHHMQ